MPSWQGKSRGTTLGYRIFVGILKNFGVLPAYLLLRFVACYYFLFSYRSSKPIYNLYRKRLRLSAGSSLIKLYKNYYQFGQSLIDKVVVMAGIPNKFSFHFDGEENLHKMVAQNTGGLLLSAHIGNWEIAGHLLKRLNTKINIVMFDGEHQQIKKYMDSVTGERNMNIIVIKNDISHIYAINDALKNNELVCMHADRFVAGNKTTETDFLGEKAPFPIGPFILASKLKTPVSFVFAMKETNLHYHFFATDLKTYDHLPRQEQVPTIVSEFAEAMEAKLKQYPEQWYNYYDFWQR